MLFDTWRIDRQFLRYFDPDMQPPPERVYGGVLRHFEQDPDLYRVLYVSQLSVPPPHLGAGKRTIVDRVRVDYHEPFTMLRYDRMTEPQYLRKFPILNLLNTRYVVTGEPFPDAPASVDHQRPAHLQERVRAALVLPGARIPDRNRRRPDPGAAFGTRVQAR